MRILICDDDRLFADNLKEIITTYFNKKNISLPEIAVYYSGDDMLNDTLVKDIVFLDVEMPGVDGISVGKRIMAENNKCIIIMITSYSEYLDDAMRFNVFRYISKPLDTKRLYRNLDDALVSYSQNQEKRITFECNHETVLCNTSSILFIEMEGKKVNIYTTNNKYSIYGTINAFEDMLPKSLFYRSHRSYIVNLAHVVEFTQDTIHLDNKHSIYLSKRKHSDFKKHWLLYLEGSK